MIRIDLRFVYLMPGKLNQTDLNRSWVKVTFKLLTQQGFRSTEMIDLYNGTSTSNYAYKDLLTYRRLLLDTDSTYEFKIKSIYGKSNMLVGLGNREMTISDDLSYNYITSVFESGDQSSIIIDPGMRRGCSGSIFTFRGGLYNCTLYAVVEC